MYQIILYEDRNGVKPVDEYLKELDSQNTKDARIRREKIRAYVKILKNVDCRFLNRYASI